MTLDLNKPVQLRNGSKVRILASDVRGMYPIVATATNPDGTETTRIYMRDGRCTLLSECAVDLVNAPEKIKGWVNVYPAEGVDGRRVMILHQTRELADKDASTDRVAVFHIDIPHGSGL